MSGLPSTSLDMDAPAPSSSRVVENMLDPSRKKKRKQRGREMLGKSFNQLMGRTNLLLFADAFACPSAPTVAESIAPHSQSTIHYRLITDFCS